MWHEMHKWCMWKVKASSQHARRNIVFISSLLHIYVGNIMVIDFAFMHSIDKEILANKNK
jgi:hypothetical protein